MKKTTKTLQAIEIYLPFFSGFYESIHDYDFYYLQQDLMDYYKKKDNSIINEDYSSDFVCDNFDYSTYTHDYSKEYVSNFNTEYLDILAGYWITNIEYSSLWSPKEYNFATDSINVNISIDKTLFNYKYWLLRRTKEFIQLVKNNCTSYDGFMSFTDNNIDSNEWNCDNLDACQYTLIIEFLILQATGKEANDIDFDLMYSTKDCIYDSEYLDYKDLVFFDKDNTSLSYDYKHYCKACDSIVTKWYKIDNCLICKSKYIHNNIQVLQINN